MPVYEYKCGKCENVFSLMQRMGAGPEGVSCPSCKATDVKKIMSLTNTPESNKAMPPSFESAAAKMPTGMGGGGCPSGMCGSGMCGI